ncbi:hypothetical protein AKJ16_DCAP20503, partial [Drosera capensis]
SSITRYLPFRKRKRRDKAKERVREKKKWWRRSTLALSSLPPVFHRIRYSFNSPLSQPLLLLLHCGRILSTVDLFDEIFVELMVVDMI